MIRDLLIQHPDGRRDHIGPARITATGTMHDGATVFTMTPLESDNDGFAFVVMPV